MQSLTLPMKPVIRTSSDSSLMDKSASPVPGPSGTVSQSADLRSKTLPKKPVLDGFSDLFAMKEPMAMK